MRLISTFAHGVIDYVAGIVLIAAPFVLGFADGGAAMWTPIVIGAGVILYSLLTNYELGLFPTISMATHLVLDALGGVLLAASPWIFQFEDAIWEPHLILGLAEVAAAAMTELTPRHEPIVRRRHHA
jgi:hypothetical protein